MFPRPARTVRRERNHSNEVRGMTQQMTTELRTTDGHSLVTGQGRTSIADSVVEKIAGVAAREVSGVHEMGRGAARAFGTIKEKLPVGGAGPSVTQGVKVEVGERQAAIDIDLVVEYGVSIPDVAQSVRDNVIQR